MRYIKVQEHALSYDLCCYLMEVLSDGQALLCSVQPFLLHWIGC